MNKLHMLWFKKIMVVFWACWWFSAVWSDVLGGLANLGLLNANWAPNTNYPYLLQVLAIYKVPIWLPPILFIGIILASLCSTLLFFLAVLGLNQNEHIWMPRTECAYIFSLMLWFAFLIGDQFTFQYNLEQNHMIQAGFELLTFFAMYLPQIKEGAH